MLHTDVDDITTMVDAYLACALWTWLTEDGDAPFSPDMLAGAEAKNYFDMRSIVRATSDCLDFCKLVAESDTYDADTERVLAEMDPAQAGHDFWLTRERHGAGFWDRGLGKAGDQLSDAAHTFGDGDLDVWREGADDWKAMLR